MSAIGSRGQDGFTLIESLTVLAITAAIGAMSFPSLQHAMTAVALVQGRQTVIADFHRARAQALVSAGPVGLTLAARANAYSWGDEPARPLPPSVHMRVEAGAPIAFFPDGSASPGVVTLWAGRTGSRIVVASTGAVSSEQISVQGAGG